MNYKRLKLNDRIVTARQIILIAQSDPQLNELILKYGFTPERLAEGLQKQEKAQQLISKRIVDFGTGLTSTQSFQASYKQARKTYGYIRRVYRVALVDASNGVLTQLRMNEKIPRSITGFIEQAQHFYKETLAMPDVLETVSNFSITQEMLTTGQAEVDAVDQTKMQQKQRKGLAQVTMQERKAIVKELDTWMTEFLSILRIATANDPQQLEKLGVVVKE